MSTFHMHGCSSALLHWNKTGLCFLLSSPFLLACIFFNCLAHHSMITICLFSQKIAYLCRFATSDLSKVLFTCTLQKGITMCVFFRFFTALKYLDSSPLGIQAP